MTGDRIVLDPEELRRTATRMRGAAVVLSGTGRDLAARPLPSMPAHVAALVTEVVHRANASLQDLADELVTEARTLEARATWAELGGGDALAWLIPGHHRVGPTPSQPVGPGSTLPSITDEQIMRAEQWALDQLDAMNDSTRFLDEETASRETRAADAPGSDLLRFADGFSVQALGGSALAAELPLEAYEHREPGALEAGLLVDGGWVGAALGGVLGEAVIGSAGVGMMGCLIDGGIGDASVGDQLGDELFE